MHPALWKLLKLRFEGEFRRATRALRTPRGAFYLVAMLALFSTWLVPLMLGAFMRQPSGPADFAREALPLGLLVVCVSSLFLVGESKIHFHPAEVDFLFAGPFTRRDLLLYKFAVTAVNSISAGIFFSLVLAQYTTRWLPSFLGATLAIFFVQMVQYAIALGAQALGERAFNRRRRTILLAGLLALATLSWFTTPHLPATNALEFLKAFRQSAIGMVLLAPFDVFARAIWSERIVPDFLFWGGAALAIDAALVATTIRLDANYLEAAMQATERRYQRIALLRRGRSPFSGTTKARWRIRPLPHLRGAGPIAWRNLIDAVRNTWLPFAILVLGAALVGPVLKMLDAPTAALAALGSGAAWFSVLFFPQAIRQDFRGDLDSLDWLKSMPISPWAVALGELAIPIVMVSSIHLALLAGLTLFRLLPAWALPIGVVLIVPLNTLLFGIENIVFLLYPTRSMATGAQDFQTAARRMMELLFKGLALGGCFLIVLMATGFAYLIFGENAVALAVVAGITLAVEAAATWPILAWAYQRFDVSLDTPPS